MEHLLKDVDWNKVLFFDIETARGKEDITEDDPIYSTLEWKFRDKNKNGEIRPFEEVRELYLKEGGLHPTLNRIVCISVGYIRGDKLYVKNITGEEHDIIEEFYSIADGRILAGHNIKQFDIPCIRIRAFANGVSVPISLCDSGLKPWDIGIDYKSTFKAIDSMDIVKGSYYYGISLAECCMIAGIDTPKDDINGSQVSEEYYKGNIDRIAAYCAKDILASANLILRLAGLETVTFSDDYIEPTNITLANKIYNSRDISDKEKDTIKTLISKKRLSKKDKDILGEILIAFLVKRSGFMEEGDSDAVVKRKEELVKELLNSK